ncbi:MAG TPA: SipW-dependent-type signal peptide-containing protein [Bacillota bacterium]|nr:SipW-dependent-type signal peptide-containing protein [Bacillota bacterium]HUM55890.1 SipW-dependent-type signal peptide-containing protein [Bacillota bacterium]
MKRKEDEKEIKTLERSRTKKKKSRFIPAFALMLMLIAGGVIALLSDSETFQNVFGMSNLTVDISAEEMMASSEIGNEGSLIQYEDPAGVLPGDIVSKIPQVGKVSENSLDCWVRAKVEFTQPENLSAEKTSLDQSALLGIPDSTWTVKNTADPGTIYYYLNNGLTGQDISKTVLFTGVQIPDDWNETEIGKTPKVNVTFEAVQMENFQQDLTSDEPWGNYN